MKRSINSCISIIIFSLIALSCDNSNLVQQNNIPPPTNQMSDASVTESDSTSHNRYMIIFKEQPTGLATSQAAQLTEEKTNTIFSALSLSRDSLLHQYKWASAGFAGRFTADQVEQLRKHPLVDHVAKDYYFKAIQVGASTKETTERRKLSSGTQTTPWGVTRINGPLSSSGNTAWVLDTGIDLNHPDLNVDISRSASFVASSPADDGNGHGTYVAGLLAAIDDTTGIVGVAAGASVVAVRVCDNGGGCYVSDVKAGVEYAAGNFSSGDVANISLNYEVNESDPRVDIPLSDMENSITNAANSGLKFTISAGNDVSDANNYSPGRIEHSNVWTISAFDDTDTFYATSNYGNPPIEFSSPGVDLPSLQVGGGSGFDYGPPNSDSGTSFAAPHMAGLLLAQPNFIASGGTVNNDPDGNPDHIAVFNPFPGPTVSISGPTTIFFGQTGNFSASASNGESPYSYSWNYTYEDCAPGSSDCSDEGVKYSGGTGSSFNMSYNSNYDTVIIEVIATDDDNDTAFSTQHVVFKDQVQ